MGGPGKDTLLGQAGSDLLNGDGRTGGEPGKDGCEGGKGIRLHRPMGNACDTSIEKVRTSCEVEKSIEKSGFVPSKFH